MKCCVETDTRTPFLCSLNAHGRNINRTYILYIYTWYLVLYMETVHFKNCNLNRFSSYKQSPQAKFYWEMEVQPWHVICSVHWIASPVHQLCLTFHSHQNLRSNQSIQLQLIKSTVLEWCWCVIWAQTCEDVQWTLFKKRTTLLAAFSSHPTKAQR